MTEPPNEQITVDALIKSVSGKTGLSTDAVKSLFQALRSGNFKMAQFNHPDLGGMGQWSGGMLMIGDMSNLELKNRVASACAELVQGATTSEAQDAFARPFEPMTRHSNEQKWWPESLGLVSSSGSQNDSDYAYFAATNRLAIRQSATVTVFDTTGYDIHGASQQQGATTSVSFNTQKGIITTEQLQRVTLP